LQFFTAYRFKPNKPEHIFILWCWKQKHGSHRTANKLPKHLIAAAFHNANQQLSDHINFSLVASDNNNQLQYSKSVAESERWTPTNNESPIHMRPSSINPYNR
jgi:hypothetical protein